MKLALHPEFLKAAPTGWEAWGEPVTLEDPSATAMIIRSTLKVDEAVLAKRPHLKYLATASSGTCHLDIRALEAREIFWMSCPGSNAEAVADWVAVALARLGIQQGTLGIIGAGHVGKRVAARYRGGDVLFCDPPRATREPGFPHVPLADIMQRADIISLHCPLDDVTTGMIDADLIASFNGKAFLNAARGGIVTIEALSLLKSRGCRIAIDVFPNEPNPSRTWFEVADFVTPHIAGHTDTAKADALQRCAAWLHEQTGIETRIAPRYEVQNGGAIHLLDRAHQRLMAGEDFRTVRSDSLRPPLLVAPDPRVMV